MADVKKSAVAVKKPVAVKKEEVKVEAVKVAEPAKKAEAPKAAAPKAAAEKKAPAKKAAAPAKKAEVKSSVVIELAADRQYTNDSLMKILKDVWKYDLKKKVSDIKTVEMYVKPYEGSVYYKVNGEVEGEFNI